jgi:hypothetical protein
MNPALVKWEFLPFDFSTPAEVLREVHWIMMANFLVWIGRKMYRTETPL